MTDTAEFRHNFTVFPDSGSVELHCYSCDTKLAIGYHPSLDRLIEQARVHDRCEHLPSSDAVTVGHG
jgi:hypothetical protein